jgi:uncharacterized membrane protein YciS (DUF1049 family)
MRIYKHTTWIASIICVVSIVIAVILEWKIDKIIINLMIGHRAFVIDFLLGVVASGLFVVAASIIGYITTKARIKAKTQFCLKQAYDKVKTHEVFMQYAIGRISAYYKLETTEKELQYNISDIVLESYELMYHLDEMLIDLYLEGAEDIYGEEVFGFIGKMKLIANGLALKTAQDSKTVWDNADRFFQDIKTPLKELESFLQKSKLLDINKQI